MFLQHDVTMSQGVTLTVHDYCLKTRSQTNVSAFPSSAKRTQSVIISFSISSGAFFTMRCPIFMKKNKRTDVFIEHVQLF